jgi:hypothetical protein
MIPSAYKNPRIPWKTDLCAICMLQTRGRVVEVELTHGVSVMLCPAHASEEFRTMRSGRDFVATLDRVWRATRSMTRNRSRALSAHLAGLNRPLRPDTDRALPGSYHWKALRNEVEHRAAEGEPMRVLVADLLARHAHDLADAPSARTVRRWYHDGRWRQNIRTALRQGYHRRDPAKASRAQKDRAHITRLRETHAAAAASLATGAPP